MATGGSFDVVLMDVEMPEIDGLEATRLIVAAMGDERPTLVALTANVLTSDREACLAAGLDHFLAKPLRRAELAAVLDDVAMAITAADEVPAYKEARLPPVAGRSATSETSVASREEFARLVTDLVGGNDPEFDQELISSFLADLPVMLQTMVDARAAGDAPTLRRAAHTLRSQAAVFGADDLIRSCRALESAAGGGDVDGHLVEDVVAGANKVEADIRVQLDHSVVGNPPASLDPPEAGHLTT